MYVTRSCCAPQRLTVFARDFAAAYAVFVDRFPDVTHITLDAFRQLFSDQQLEYMHFSGATTFGTVWHDVVVHDVLQLSAAYLYVPRELARPHVRVFGLLLCYMFFATQPLAGNASQLPLMQVDVAVDVMEQLLHLLPQPLRDDDDKIVLPVAQFDAALYRDVLSDAEVHALVSLHAAQAWRLQPFVDVGAHIVALLHAHHAAHAPLLSTHTATLPTAPSYASALSSVGSDTDHRCDTHCVVDDHATSLPDAHVVDVHDGDGDMLASRLREYARLKAQAHM